MTCYLPTEYPFRDPDPQHYWVFWRLVNQNLSVVKRSLGHVGCVGGSGYGVKRLKD